MNLGVLAFLTVFFTFLLFLIFRVEAKHRRIVAVCILLVLLLTRGYIMERQWDSEGITAFIAALVLNFLFWALIGRYNPVRSDDEIKVIGLDD
jgi:uncharacterized membrane protein